MDDTERQAYSDYIDKKSEEELVALGISLEDAATLINFAREMGQAMKEKTNENR